jgi:hypothetical protein
MSLRIIIRVAVQEEDIAVVLETPTKQQMIKNKIETPHHFQ